MTPAARPLAGCRIGLSISEPDDPGKAGFPPWQINRVTLRMVAALFGQGAGVVFGHDWREDGVMEAVYGFAQMMQPQGPDAAGEPLLYNLVPWPEQPRLSPQERERLRSTLLVEQAGLPAELAAQAPEALAQGPHSAAYRNLRATGLTHLRRELNRVSHARLCLGGRTIGYAGRYPGIIEEALLALESGKPLYLSGLLGGAARQVIDAIEGLPMPPDFRAPADPEATGSDASSSQVWNRLQHLGVEGMSGKCGLSAAECLELFHSAVLDRVIELVLMGVSRLRSRERL